METICFPDVRKRQKPRKKLLKALFIRKNHKVRHPIYPLFSVNSNQKVRIVKLDSEFDAHLTGKHMLSNRWKLFIAIYPIYYYSSTVAFRGKL